MQGFVLCAHCHDLKIVLENLILCSFGVCQALFKLVNYFLGHARPLPAEQIDISGNEITGNEMIEIYLDVAFQVKDPRERLERGCTPCGACKSVHGYVKSLLSREGRIKIYFRVLPSIMPSRLTVLLNSNISRTQLLQEVKVGLCRVKYGK